jgi:peptidoglycan hydrolase-like protein with peptidoglycan-binding domain
MADPAPALRSAGEAVSPTRSAQTTASPPDTESRFPDGRPPPAEERPRRRPRVRLAAIGAIILARGAGAALVALQSGSQKRNATGTGIPPGDTTTTVERRTLVERSSVDGTLSYGGPVELYDRLAGTFTWLPAVGAVIGRGGTLLRVDNLPVALMSGSVPAYRALKEGVGDGPDVNELNVNLIDLGFDPYGAITDDDHFGEASAAAVRRWQKAEGLPQTGEVELGRVMFAAGARRITAVHVTVGEDPPPSASKEPTGRKPASKEPGARKSSAAEKATKESQSEKAAKGRGEREQAAKEHAARESSKENSSKEPGGAGGAAPVLVLGTTTTQQIVQLQVKADQQELAHIGESAPVTLPNGDVVQGQITNVGTVATESSENEKEKGGGNPSSGSGENATISVTLALEHRVARLDKAPVSVQLVKSIRHNVLAVPATALVATAGGGYAIEALEGSRRRELAVTPGMFTNGYVEIEGASIHAGVTVMEPR